MVTGGNPRIYIRTVQRWRDHFGYYRTPGINPAEVRRLVASHAGASGVTAHRHSSLNSLEYTTEMRRISRLPAKVTREFSVAG